MLRLAAVLVAFLPFEGAAVKLHRSANVSEQCSGLFDWKACEAESTCVWEFASGACQETGYAELIGHMSPDTWDMDNPDDVCSAPRQPNKNKDQCGQNLPQGGGYFYGYSGGNWCRHFSAACVEIMRGKVGTAEWNTINAGNTYLPAESVHLPVRYAKLKNDLVAKSGSDVVQGDIRDVEGALIDLSARVTENLSA